MTQEQKTRLAEVATRMKDHELISLPSGLLDGDYTFSGVIRLEEVVPVLPYSDSHYSSSDWDKIPESDIDKVLDFLFEFCPGEETVKQAPSFVQTCKDFLVRVLKTMPHHQIYFRDSFGVDDPHMFTSAEGLMLADEEGGDGCLYYIREFEDPIDLDTMRDMDIVVMAVRLHSSLEQPYSEIIGKNL